LDILGISFMGGVFNCKLHDCGIMCLQSKGLLGRIIWIRFPDLGLLRRYLKWDKFMESTLYVDVDGGNFAKSMPYKISGP
jgi:hypothetical protein